MRGGSLTCFRPDGFTQDFILAIAQEGWEGLKTGGPLGLPNIAEGIRGIKRGGKRAIKRKAVQEINKVANEN